MLINLNLELASNTKNTYRKKDNFHPEIVKELTKTKSYLRHTS